MIVLIQLVIAAPRESPGRRSKPQPASSLIEVDAPLIG